MLIRIVEDEQQTDREDDEIIVDNGLYMLQTIKMGKASVNLFFDSGCSDVVCRFEAIQRMGEGARQEIQGPLSLGGVGDLKLISPHGVYKISLPLYNGKNAVLSGICIDQITTVFPTYPLHGKIKSDVYKGYIQDGGDVNDLPTIPEYVGGAVDIMIGSKYQRYQPVPVFSLLSGLTIYRSPFINASGGRGVIGGPHEVITEIDRLRSETCQYSSSYLNEQYKLYKMGYCVNPDNKSLGVKVEKDFCFDVLMETK